VSAEALSISIADPTWASDRLPERVAAVVGAAMPEPGHGRLLRALDALIPHQPFRRVLSRGGWHRAGGLVAPGGAYITHELEPWAERVWAECGEDTGALQRRYGQAGLVVTRLDGKSHYLVSHTGDSAADFLQLEVEELQEAHDRLFLERGASREDLYELIDPAHYRRLEPIPVGRPRYVFRRLTHIPSLVAAMVADVHPEEPAIARLLRDWELSSAGQTTCFCEHFVLGLRESCDRYGQVSLRAKPVPTAAGVPGLEPASGLRGAELANLLRDFDRKAGFPFAWFFLMAIRDGVDPRVAEAVTADLQDGYDYVAERDAEVLARWVRFPYSA